MYCALPNPLAGQVMTIPRRNPPENAETRALTPARIGAIATPHACRLGCAIGDGDEQIEADDAEHDRSQFRHSSTGLAGHRARSQHARVGFGALGLARDVRLAIEWTHDQHAVGPVKQQRTRIMNKP